MSEHVSLHRKTTPSFTPVQTGLLQRKCACGQHTIAGGECAECRQKREGTMQRAAVNSAPTNAIPPIVHDVLRSSGQPLDAGTRAFMEPRFNHDFSQVRVHTDARAAESALAVNALAYTVGRDVVFGTGQYEPGIGEGRRLLAHELTHVVQQAQNAGTSMQKANSLQVSEPNDIFEVEAEMQTTRIMNSNGTQPIEKQVHGNLLQRRSKPPKGVALPEGMTELPEGVVVTSAQPKHNWSAIRKEAERKCGVQSAIDCICALASSPQEVFLAARAQFVLRNLPLAIEHLDHYLEGKGADFKEDLEAVIKQDEKVRALLRRKIKEQGRRGHTKVHQGDYANQDFVNSFGAIDRLDFEVLGGVKKGKTAASETAQVHVWFIDRYEWQPQDKRRSTNCIHKAMVELKDEGARDYWMVGDATVPLSLIKGHSESSQTDDL